MKEIHTCYYCGQTMMTYRRSIRANMLYCLRKLFFDYGEQPKKTTEIDDRKNIESDFTKLKYWNLIQPMGKNRYQITKRGIEFILGRIMIRKYKWVYNQKVQDDPADAENPMISCWDIAPQEITKQTVLDDARRYPVIESPQEELFKNT